MLLRFPHLRVYKRGLCGLLRLMEADEELGDGDEFALFLEAQVGADDESDEPLAKKRKLELEEEQAPSHSQLGQIPPEIFPKILKFLSAEDLSNCGQVCKYLRSVTCDEPLWKRLYCVRWGHPKTSKSLTWKQMYIERDRLDVTEALRNSPAEFKEYYLQMQVSKRSEAPPAKASDDLWVVDHIDQTIGEQVNAWRRSQKLAENFNGSHTCSGQTCSYHQIGNVYICEKTGCAHACGDACREVIVDMNDIRVCKISGRCFDPCMFSVEEEDEETQPVATEEAEPFMGTGRLGRLYTLGYSCKDDREFENALRSSGLGRSSEGLVYGNC